MTERAGEHGPERDDLVRELDDVVRRAYDSCSTHDGDFAEIVAPVVFNLLEMCVDDAERYEVKAIVEGILDKYGIRDLEIGVWRRVGDMWEDPLRQELEDLLGEIREDYSRAGRPPKIRLEMFPGARDGDVLLKGMVMDDGGVSFLDTSRGDFEDDGLFSGFVGQMVEVVLLGGNLCVVPVGRGVERVESPHLTAVTVEASGVDDARVVALIDRLFSEHVRFSAHVVDGGVHFEIELPSDEAAVILAEQGYKRG